MFFNKDKKIGRALASSAIRLPEEQIRQLKETVKGIQFSEIEFRRLRFCLSILDLASMFWWVNFFGKLSNNINRVEKILDNASEIFMNEFINDKVTIRIRDYIVDNDEIMFVYRKLGGGGLGFADGATTTIATLAPIIYNIRISQYNAAFVDRFKLLSAKGPGILDPVAKLFVKHFAGENSINYARLVVEISILLAYSNAAIGGIVKDGVKW